MMHGRYARSGSDHTTSNLSNVNASTSNILLATPHAGKPYTPERWPWKSYLRMNCIKTGQVPPSIRCLMTNLEVAS
jgi:hypothetical protein